VALAVRNPYDVAQLPSVKGCLASYGWTDVEVRAAGDLQLSKRAGFARDPNETGFVRVRVAVQTVFARHEHLRSDTVDGDGAVAFARDSESQRPDLCLVRRRQGAIRPGRASGPRRAPRRRSSCRRGSGLRPS